MFKKTVMGLLTVIAVATSYPFAETAYRNCKNDTIRTANSSALQAAKDRLDTCNLQFQLRPEDCDSSGDAAAEEFGGDGASKENPPARLQMIRHPRPPLVSVIRSKVRACNAWPSRESRPLQ
jgi:hypothetical protein